MTRIQKVVREIENLQDFYKRTKWLRTRIKKKDSERTQKNIAYPRCGERGTGRSSRKETTAK